MATSNTTIPAFIIGAVLGAGITYFGLGNPPGGDIAGTIASADRYQAAQPGYDDI